MSRGSWSLLLVGALAAAAFGQAPAAEDEDPLGPPTDVGVRFTPSMARGLASLYTDGVLTNRYSLEPSRKQEAVEAITRRLMAAAHATDGQGQDLAEYLITEIADMRARGEHRPGPNFLKDFGKGVLPMVPAMRTLVRDFANDVRPLLPVKGQLKLTADLALAASALDSFQENMRRWSRGEGEIGENPFEPANQNNPAARERIVKNARLVASQAVDRDYAQEWKAYLDQAKQFYAFDAAQVTTGESILREFTDRAQTLKMDATLREKVHDGRLWMSLAAQLKLPGKPQLQWLFVDNYERLTLPLRDLEREFKTRIDEIPTEAQRTAADARLLAELTKQGYTTTAEAQP